MYEHLMYTLKNIVHFYEVFLWVFFIFLGYIFLKRKNQKVKYNKSQLIKSILNFFIVYTILIISIIHMSNYYYIPVKQNVVDDILSKKGNNFKKKFYYIDSLNYEIEIPIKKLTNSSNDNYNDAIIYNHLLNYTLLKIHKDNTDFYTQVQIKQNIEEFLEVHEPLLNYE